MSTTMFFFFFIPFLALVLLAINLIFAPHNPYQEKNSAFECGFHSFLGQNRTQFSISFFVFALLFLLFDLEILLVYPYIVSAYTNDIYGLVIMLLFFLLLTLGFAFELGKNALKIDSRQVSTLPKPTSTTFKYVSFSSFSLYLNRNWYLGLKNKIFKLIKNNLKLWLTLAFICQTHKPIFSFFGASLGVNSNFIVLAFGFIYALLCLTRGCYKNETYNFSLKDLLLI